MEGLRVGVGPASSESLLVVVEGEFGRGLIVALVADGMVEQALTEVDGRSVDTVLLTDDSGLSQGLESLGVVEEKEEIDRPFPQQCPHLQPLVVVTVPPLTAFGGPVEVEHGGVAPSRVGEGDGPVDELAGRGQLHIVGTAARSPRPDGMQEQQEGHEEFGGA